MRGRTNIINKKASVNGDSTFTFELALNNDYYATDNLSYMSSQFIITDDIRSKYTKLKVIKTDVSTSRKSLCSVRLERDGIYSKIPKGIQENLDGIVIYNIADISDYISIKGDYNAYAKITCVLYND